MCEPSLQRSKGAFAWDAIPVTPAEEDAWRDLAKLTPGGPTPGRGTAGGVPDARCAASSSGHPIHGAQGDTAGLDRCPASPNLLPTSAADCCASLPTGVPAHSPLLVGAPTHFDAHAAA